MFVVVIVFNVPPTAKVIWRQGQVWYLIVKIPGHEVIQLFACSTQLSGRVLDSRPKGSGFEPHRRHCVVVLEQDTFILA